jgi:hypothetical protein
MTESLGLNGYPNRPASSPCSRSVSRAVSVPDPPYDDPERGEHRSQNPSKHGPRTRGREELAGRTEHGDRPHYQVSFARRSVEGVQQACQRVSRTCRGGSRRERGERCARGFRLRRIRTRPATTLVQAETGRAKRAARVRRRTDHTHPFPATPLDQAFEQQYIHHVARVDAALFMMQHDHAIRFGH